MDKYIINFTGCKNIDTFHTAIKKGLKFRDGYGENMDAFWDFLRDFGKYEFCIEILGLDTLDKSLNEEVNMMINLMEEYRERNNPHLVIKIVYNGDDVFI